MSKYPALVLQRQRMIRPRTNINAHKYPFRNRVTKSFLPADWVCK